MKSDQMLRYIINVAVIMTVMVAPGCKKFVEIDPPKTELVTETVYKNASTATAALTAIYAKMVDYNLTYNVPFYTGLYGDELLNYSTSPAITSFYQANMDADNYYPGVWSEAYNLIYQANAVWEGCAQSVSLPDPVKRQLMAEAKFIRAYWFFYLVNLYGDVPLTLTTDYKINGTMPRTSSELVNDQIISDLKESRSNLNDNYVDESDTTLTMERVRPNKAAAAALLARVFLFRGNYEEAANYSSEVIANPLYDTVKLSDVFLANSTETIWQIPPTSSTPTFNTQEGLGFILTDQPTSSTLSATLLNAFEPGDKRKQEWIGLITIGTDSFFFPYKYKVKASTTVTEYSTALRIAEQYLIRAEAEAAQGLLAEAQSDLNIIRKRAGLNETTASTKEELLSAIIRERQLEFFSEWGHRWMDLKRTGMVDSVMQTISSIKNANWASYKAYWPIPRKDIINNPQLVQTQGYN